MVTKIFGTSHLSFLFGTSHLSFLFGTSHLSFLSVGLTGTLLGVIVVGVVGAAGFVYFQIFSRKKKFEAIGMGEEPLNVTFWVVDCSPAKFEKYFWSRKEGQSFNEIPLPPKMTYIYPLYRSVETLADVHDNFIKEVKHVVPRPIDKNTLFLVYSTLNKGQWSARKPYDLAPSWGGVIVRLDLNHFHPKSKLKELLLSYV